MSYITYWRIASTSGGLATGHLYALGIPPPDLSFYQEYTNLVPQSLGGKTRQGYAHFRALWNGLTSEQFYTLSSIIEAGISGGSLYATIDRANGTGVLNDFIDVHGEVWPLQYEPISRSRGLVFANVELNLNAIAIDTAPSAVF